MRILVPQKCEEKKYSWKLSDVKISSNVAIWASDPIEREQETHRRFLPSGCFHLPQVPMPPSATHPIFFSPFLHPCHCQKMFMGAKLLLRVHIFHLISSLFSFHFLFWWSHNTACPWEVACATASQLTPTGTFSFNNLSPPTFRFWPYHMWATNFIFFISVFLLNPTRLVNWSLRSSERYPNSDQQRYKRRSYGFQVDNIIEKSTN